MYLSPVLSISGSTLHAGLPYPTMEQSPGTGTGLDPTRVLGFVRSCCVFEARSISSALRSAQCSFLLMPQQSCMLGSADHTNNEGQHAQSVFLAQEPCCAPRPTFRKRPHPAQDRYRYPACPPPRPEMLSPPPSTPSTEEARLFPDPPYLLLHYTQEA